MKKEYGKYYKEHAKIDLEYRTLDEGETGILVKQKIGRMADKQKCCTILDFEMGIGDLTRKAVSIEKLFNISRLPSTFTVLDLGCGLGYHLKLLSCNKVGLDIAKRNLQQAKHVDRKAHFVLGDIEYLPFKASSTDVVSLLEVVHHLPSYRRAFEQVKQVLKHNGLLLIVDEQKNADAPIWPIALTAKAISHLKGHHAEGSGMPLTKGIQFLTKLNFSILDVRTKGSFMKRLLALYTTAKGFPSERRYEEKGFVPYTLSILDSTLRKIIPPQFLLWYKLVAKLCSPETKVSISPIIRDDTW